MLKKKHIKKISIALWFVFVLVITLFLIIKIVKLSEQKKTELPVYKTDFIVGSENPLLSLELFPNYTGFFDGSSVRINVTHIETNPDGLRDYTYSIDKPENATRILVIGDSYEFGWGVEQNESYPKVLEKLLNENSLNRYEVINLGIPGYVMYEKTEFFRYKGLKYDPDIIIIGLLGNDFGNNTEATRLIQDFNNKLSEENKKKLIKKTEQEIAIEADRLATLIIRKEEADQTIEEKWSIVKGPLDDIYDLTHEKNIIVILLNHVEQPIPEEISLRIKEYIKDKNWFYFDCMDTSVLNLEWDIPGDGHPNSMAHRIMAETIYENMKLLNLIK